MVGLTEEERIRSYPERWVSFLPIPFWLAWVLIWGAVYAIDFLLARAGQPHSHLTELGVSVFCASVCITLGLSSYTMHQLYADLCLFIDAPESELKPWYDKTVRVMYMGAGPLILGAAFAIVTELTVGLSVNQFNQSSTTLLYFRMLYRIVGFFMLGMSLWATINAIRLPSQLMQFKLKLRLSNISGIGVQALGTAFFKHTMFALIPFIFLAFTIVVSPLSQDAAVLVWASVGAVVIFCLFLLPQIGVHRIMAREKRQQLIAFSEHLEEALHRSRVDPSSENMKKLKEMFDLGQYLKSLNSWPFDTSTLWQLITALLLPLLPIVLQLLFKL